MIEKSKQLMAI